MTTYRRFIEVNDNEGETWNFWLQVDGNMTGLAVLGDILDKVHEGIDRPFTLADDQLEEHEVDLLVRFGESGYMNQHTRVDGSLSLPADFTSTDYDGVTGYLYKGAIYDLFKDGGAL